MSIEAYPTDLQIRRTHIAFIWTSILGVPFWGIYALLLFILYKDLHATPFQIATFIILKPLMSIFSIYWSAHVCKRRDRLRANVLWAGLLAPFPFLFFPVIESPWFIILASALYMMFVRGVYPAWMEILKLNLTEEMRQKAVSYSTTISFVGGGILSLLISYLMDINVELWRVIFPLAAAVSILSVFFQWRLIIPPDPERIEPPVSQPLSVNLVLSHVMNPWKRVWDLLSSRPDFRRFHFGYMLGGFGLVIVQPALPVFFIDTLNLSYTELTTAITLCKGIAFALTSTAWSRWLRQVNIYKFSSFVALLVSIFPFLLISAQWHLVWVFIAYLVYGVMQSGSELNWHLAGPMFAKGEDSSVYSSVNLVVVGLRGCVAPLLGSLLVAAFSPVTVLLIGGVLSFFASWRLFSYHKQYSSGEVYGVRSIHS